MHVQYGEASQLEIDMIIGESNKCSVMGAMVHFLFQTSITIENHCECTTKVFSIANDKSLMELVLILACMKIN